jgi:hypothetical protein
VFCSTQSQKHHGVRDRTLRPLSIIIITRVLWGLLEYDNARIENNNNNKREMRLTTRLLAAATTPQPFRVSVEWSPKLAAIAQSPPPPQQQQQQLQLSRPDYFVFPDLPEVHTADDREMYERSTLPEKRLQTVAACRFDNAKSLVGHVVGLLSSRSTDNISCKRNILLVGGNENKGANNKNTLSTIEAANILRSETTGDDAITLWGVANPNDPQSVEYTHRKVEAGISGFLTQPLLASHALETLIEYPSSSSGGDATNNDDIVILAGMAFPRTAQNLQFWAKLIDYPPLQDDPLFQSHVAFFSQPYVTPLAWIGRELHDLTTRASDRIDGVHLMPLHNTEDLLAVVRSLPQQCKEEI